MEALLQFNLKKHRVMLTLLTAKTDNILEFGGKSLLKMLKETSLGFYSPYEMFLRRDIIFKSISKWNFHFPGVIFFIF